MIQSSGEINDKENNAAGITAKEARVAMATSSPRPQHGGSSSRLTCGVVMLTSPHLLTITATKHSPSPKQRVKQSKKNVMYSHL